MLFALCTTTPLVTQRDLYFVARALEPVAGEFADAWGLVRPAIVVCASPDSLRRECQPVICTEKDELDTGFEAYHRKDAFHGTLSRAFVLNATGMFTGGNSISERISHEVLEALGDPYCDLWTHMPGRLSSHMTPIEVCDPLQDVVVVHDDGNKVEIANYVHRSFYDDRLSDPEAAASFLASGGKFDRLGTLSFAGQIGPEGYAVFKDTTTGAKWMETSAGRVGGSTKPGAAHPAARTMRRLAA